jgi:hypothetical protein
VERTSQTIPKRKRYGKTIDKKEFEEKYLIYDNQIVLKNNDQVLNLFEKHIKCEDFGSDGVRGHPEMIEEVDKLEQEMKSNGMYERN